MKATRKVGVKKRKGTGVMTASEKWELSRWNRKDSPRKQIEDVTESLRAYLVHADEVSLLEFARILYTKHAVRPEIAKDYVAIKDHDSLCAFLYKYDNPVAPLSLADLEAARALGLVTDEQANEVREWLKEGQC